MKRATLTSFALATLLLALTAASPKFFSTKTRAAASSPVTNSSTVPLYRLYSPSTGIHFYTTDVNRRLEAMGAGWTSEGVAAHVLNQPAPGAVSLYVLVIRLRFVNPSGSEFYGHAFGYTTSEDKKDELLHSPPRPTLLGGTNDPWELDSTGVAGYVAQSRMFGTVPLYELNHPAQFQIANNVSERVCRLSSYDNLYTTSEEEKANAITSHGYKFVGIAGYVWPQATSLGPHIAPGSPPPGADTDLLNRGCTRPGAGSYKCPTIGGYEACEKYRINGKVTACSTTANQKVQAAMEKLLFSVGCKRFLGRPDDFLCKTQKSLDLCQAYCKNGTAKKCRPFTP